MKSMKTDFRKMVEKKLIASIKTATNGELSYVWDVLVYCSNCPLESECKEECDIKIFKQLEEEDSNR